MYGSCKAPVALLLLWGFCKALVVLLQCSSSGGVSRGGFLLDVAEDVTRDDVLEALGALLCLLASLLVSGGPPSPFS